MPRPKEKPSTAEAPPAGEAPSIRNSQEQAKEKAPPVTTTGEGDATSENAGQGRAEVGAAKITGTIPQPEFDERTEYAERVVPDHIAKGFSGYRVEELRTRGATAIGDGALAFGITIEGPEEPAPFRTEPFEKHDPATYEPAGTDHELKQILAVQNLVYLHGRLMTGRRSTAVAALTDLGITDIHELRALDGACLADLLRYTDLLHAGTGYLYEARAEHVERTDLRTLNSVAKRIGAVLVVMGDTEDVTGQQVA